MNKLHSIAIALLLVVIMAGSIRAQTSPVQALGTSATIRSDTMPAASDASTLARKLGLSAEQAAHYRDAIASGGLSNEQLEELSARAEAKGLNPAELSAIARSMGLNEAQLQQLQRFTEPAQHPGALAQGSSATATPPPVSEIERKFATLDNPDATAQPPDTTHLTQFGYSLYQGGVSTFAPIGEVPVGKDYVLGPGDELKIETWGRFTRTMTVTVDRDGAIFLQDVGPLQVAGLTLDQAQRLIQGHIDQITGIQSQVTMGRLRTIQVFVLGEVGQPGAYTISALSRLSNALAAAGGISKIGSLRHVELRREGRTVRVIDLYDMLIRGDNRNDARLQPQDVIFVPVIGAVAAVAGDVKRPGIYELQGSGASLPQVLRLAGGTTAFSYAERVQVIRTANHTHMLALDVDLNGLATHPFTVQDGDLIKIFPVLPGPNNEVILTGNVRRPGNYQWYEGMRVADLVNRGEGVMPHTFFSYALLKRLQGADQATVYRPINLTDALADALSPSNFALRPGDELDIFSEGQMHDQPTVRIEGQVRAPGVYPLSRGMKVADLIYAAGGPSPQAYLARAELARTTVLDGAHTVHKYFTLDLRAALAGDPDQDLPLSTNDQVSVWSAPGWHLPWIVNVEGRVMRPGPYTIRAGERLDSVLRRCGGLLPDAYLPGMVFIRQSIQRSEQKEFDAARARLANSLAQLQLTQAQSTTSSPNPLNVDSLQHLLTQAEGIQVPGRLIIQMNGLQDGLSSSQDVVLENEDRIIVPQKPSSVAVLGQVYNPTAIVYDPAWRVEDYLQHAGGATELADRDNIYVIRANGSIWTRDGYDLSHRSRIFPLLPVISGGLMASRLQPGDTVYVPDKIIRTDKLQTAKDVATIIGQSLTALGIVGVLATSL
jgi:protein involved in polysaccharide export with SLBB domain